MPRYVIGDDFGDKAQAESLGRRHFAPRENEIHRALIADQAWQSNKTASEGRQTPLRLRQRKFGLLCGQDNVAREGKLKAAAKGKSLNEKKAST